MRNESRKRKAEGRKVAKNREQRVAVRTGLVLFAFCFLFSAFARADTVTFTGTGIAMRGCKIIALQGGQVSYNDPNGQRQRRPLDQIEALGFDGLPELDQAEAVLATQDYQRGLWPLLRAALKAQTDVQRIWIHARLSHVHDLRGEYVQAAGHAARCFTLSDDVAWKSLRPVSPINTPTFAAAHEALENLNAATRRVKSAELQREIEIMTRLVQGVHDRLAAEYKGAAIKSDSTISGFARETVLANEQEPADAGAVPAAAPTKPEASGRQEPSEPAPAPAVPSESSNDPRSAAAIDRLLTAGRGDDAVKLCEEIARNPGERDLAKFLYQFGKALSLAGRKADAAVMLTRCAILYPDSGDAILATIETAVIYRDEYRNVATARRLLRQAIADAEREQQQAALMLAKEVLASLPAQ